MLTKVTTSWCKAFEIYGTIESYTCELEFVVL